MTSSIEIAATTSNPESLLEMQQLAQGALAMYEATAKDMAQALRDASPDTFITFRIQGQQGLASSAATQLNFARMASAYTGRPQSEFMDGDAEVEFRRSAFARIGLGGEPMSRTLDFYLDSGSHMDTLWSDFTMPVESPEVSIETHEPSPNGI